MGELEGRVAIVTGSSSGIGEAVARRLSELGCRVVVNSSSSEAAGSAVAESLPSEALYVRADISDQAQGQGLIVRTIEEFGRLDVLVNNAGVYKFAPLEEISEAEYQRQFGVNVLGPLQTTREALPLFGPQGGSVINISSIVSRMGIPGSAVYAGTKGALDTITQVLASELGARKIRVNSINPGMVESEGTHTAGFIGSDFQKNVEASAPLGRIGQPDDVAKVAVFLASDDSAWLTGERISASGGHR